MYVPEHCLVIQSLILCCLVLAAGHNVPLVHCKERLRNDLFCVELDVQELSSS